MLDDITTELVDSFGFSLQVEKDCAKNFLNYLISEVEKEKESLRRKGVSGYFTIVVYAMPSTIENWSIWCVKKVVENLKQRPNTPILMFRPVDFGMEIHYRIFID